MSLVVRKEAEMRVQVGHSFTELTADDLDDLLDEVEIEETLPVGGVDMDDQPDEEEVNRMIEKATRVREVSTMLTDPFMARMKQVRDRCFLMSL